MSTITYAPAPATVLPAVSPPDEAALVLEEGADVIERDGWWDGVLTDEGLIPENVKCVALAINHVCERRGLSRTDSSVLNKAARHRFRQHLGLEEREGSIDHWVNDSIPPWNDAQKDARVVIRAMREAASS